MDKSKFSEKILREDFKKVLPLVQGWDALFYSLLIFLFSFQYLYSQTPPYYHYTSSEGLPSSTVFDMLQDKEGFMWFGTLNGLSRFDGKHFINFNEKDGLNSAVITTELSPSFSLKFIKCFPSNLLKPFKVPNHINPSLS